MTVGFASHQGGGEVSDEPPFFIELLDPGAGGIIGFAFRKHDRRFAVGAAPSEGATGVPESPSGNDDGIGLKLVEKVIPVLFGMGGGDGLESDRDASPRVVLGRVVDLKCGDAISLLSEQTIRRRKPGGVVAADRFDNDQEIHAEKNFFIAKTQRREDKTKSSSVFKKQIRILNLRL
jgi:hypothetical protein